MSTNSRGVYCAALFATSFGAAAQAPPPLQDTVHFLTYENDSRFFTDRFYTSGVQFSVKHSTDTRGAYARRLTASMCRLARCDADKAFTSQANFGQLMYTPRDITLAAAQPFDRPWAGMLYYEQTYAFLSPDQRVLTTFSGQIGVTGRASLAEPAQKAFHHLLDRPQPQGWDKQIGGSLGVMLSAEKRSARESLSFDLPGKVRQHPDLCGGRRLGGSRQGFAARVAAPAGHRQQGGRQRAQCIGVHLLPAALGAVHHLRQHRRARGGV